MAKVGRFRHTPNKKESRTVGRDFEFRVAQRLFEGWKLVSFLLRKASKFNESVEGARTTTVENSVLKLGRWEVGRCIMMSTRVQLWGSWVTCHDLEGFPMRGFWDEGE